MHCAVLPGLTWHHCMHRSLARNIRSPLTYGEQDLLSSSVLHSLHDAHALMLQLVLQRSRSPQKLGHALAKLASTLMPRASTLRALLPRRPMDPRKRGLYRHVHDGRYEGLNSRQRMHCSRQQISTPVRPLPALQ